MTTTDRISHILSIYTRLIGKPVHECSVVSFEDVFFVYHVDLARGLLICSEFIESTMPNKATDPRLAAQDRSLATFFKSHMPLSVHFGLPLPMYTVSSQRIYRYLIQHRTQSWTYGELAAAIFGSPSYSRVVATAMSHNFLPVFIPCHLVTHASGMDAYSALGSKNRTDLKARLVHCEGLTRLSPNAQIQGVPARPD